MAQTAEKVEELNVPDGGIGNFIMDDAEMDAAYGPDDGSEEFGNEGIAQFPALTKKMAAMGREGDDTIAHVETGELVIPAAFFENDPQLKESLFERFREMGVENPERYVVGSGENSINPDTGAYEFFFKFIKKAVKGIGKAIKNVVKGVVKVIKKVAPVVLPIVGSMVFGPIYGAAMGSGIATLINGGSVKDALKSALISGATGALGAGVSGAMSGTGFIDGMKNAASFSNLSAGFDTMGAALKGDFSGISMKNMSQGPTAEGGTAYTGAEGGLTPDALTTSSELGAAKDITAGTNAPVLETGVDTSVGSALDGAKTGADAAITASDAAQQALAGTYEAPGFTESLMKGNFKDAFFPQSPNAAEILKAGGIDTLSATTAQQTAAQELAKQAAPGLVRTYGPLAAAGTAVAGATGFFTPPEQPPLPDFIETNPDGTPVTGSDLVEANPGDYLISDLGNIVLNPETGEYEQKPTATTQGLSASDFVVSDLDTTKYQPPGSFEAPTEFALNTSYLRGSNPGGPFARPYVTAAADGGAIFPRRNGGIMPNEGVPGKDSVRAMLMPGEFVMTTDAVRGLGNGNLNQGIQNMYSVMRNLESRGRQTA